MLICRRLRAELKPRPGAQSHVVCLRLFYARHHPTVCCSPVRHRAEIWERDQKPRQRLLFALSPLSRFSLSLGSFTSRALDPHLHTGSREPPRTCGEWHHRERRERINTHFNSTTRAIVNRQPCFPPPQFPESWAGHLEQANDISPAISSGRTIPAGRWPFQSAAKRGRKSKFHAWQKPDAIFGNNILDSF